MAGLWLCPLDGARGLPSGYAQRGDGLAFRFLTTTRGAADTRKGYEMSFAVIDTATGVIYGTGETIAGAVADAAIWCDQERGAELAAAPILESARNLPSRGWAIVPASWAFCRTVEARGGDIGWSVDSRGLLTDAGMV